MMEEVSSDDLKILEEFVTLDDESLERLCYETTESFVSFPESRFIDLLDAEKTSDQVQLSNAVDFLMIYNCANCLKDFLPEDFEKHVCAYDKNHQLIQSTNLKDEAKNPKIFECVKCCRKFVLYNDMFCHWYSHVVEHFPGPMEQGAKLVTVTLCAFCGEVFENFDDAYKHMNKNHVDIFDRWRFKNFSSSQQQEPTTVQKNDPKDFLRTIPIAKLYQCEFCDSIFANAKSMLLHASTHPPSSAFNCFTCEIKYMPYKDLLLHRLNDCNIVRNKKSCLVDIPRVWVCNVCDEEFRGLEQLITHRREVQHLFPRRDPETNKLAFLCEICLARFKSAQQYFQHIDEKHKQTITENEVAEIPELIKQTNKENKVAKISKIAKITTKHVKEDKVVKIPKVQKSPSERRVGVYQISTRSRRNLQHIGEKKKQKITENEVAEIPEPIKQTNKKNKVAKITKISKITTKHVKEDKVVKTPKPPKHQLGVHQASTRSSRQLQLIGEKQKQKITENEVIEISKATTKQRSKQTIKEDKVAGISECIQKSPSKCRGGIHQTSSRSRQYLCNVCGKSYTQSSHLFQHMRFHQGVKNYRCDFEGCGRSFIIRPDLNDHKRKCHTGERPFLCKTCNKRFMTGSVFYQHRLIHRNERRYKCEECDKQYTRALALKKHVSKKHPLSCSGSSKCRKQLKKSKNAGV